MIEQLHLLYCARLAEVVHPCDPSWRGTALVLLSAAMIVGVGVLLGLSALCSCFGLRFQVAWVSSWAGRAVAGALAMWGAAWVVVSVIPDTAPSLDSSDSVPPAEAGGERHARLGGYWGDGGVPGAGRC